VLSPLAPGTRVPGYVERVHPRDVLAEDRRQALNLVRGIGQDKARALLRRAQAELERRLDEAIHAGPGVDSYTATMLRESLVQVRHVTAFVQGGIKKILIDSGEMAAEHGGGSVVRHLTASEEHHAKGAGRTPIRLDEAAIIDAARTGVESSILRRLASDPNHPARLGILQRYGLATIEHFEDTLQQMHIAQTPWEDVKVRLAEASPFLRGAPAHWAERIVRNECMGTINRAAWEANRAADEQLGDVVKILAATFDSRTSCLVGSTRVAGTMVRAIFRRTYEGAGTRIVTESGRKLTATPNHPMLTRRGWIGAGQLRLGDELVCDAGEEHSGAARNEHITGRPPMISEVFEAIHREGDVSRRRGTKQDFYGDGTDREIDVLRPNRELRLGNFSPLRQPFLEKFFTPPHDVLTCSCGALLPPSARLRTSLVCLCASSQDYAGLTQPKCDECLRHSELFSDVFDGSASQIRVDHPFRRKGTVPGMLSGVEKFGSLMFPVFASDSSAIEFLEHVAAMNVERGGHLSSSQPRQIKFDRLVHIESTSISGHVFDLSTSVGYFTAEGIYTGNSDSYAVHGQVRRPEEAFQDWHGFYQHPPGRPNDREVVVTHRKRWPIPAYLQPKSDADVVARWHAEGRKGSPPPRPKLSTVPLEEFGKTPRRR
jgi:hypothetical protein